MQADTFEKRIRDGKVNNLVYSKGEMEGLVSVWKHESSIIVTWEECPKGEQYDESTYSHDERHVFSSLSDVMRFLSGHGFDLDAFAP